MATATYFILGLLFTALLAGAVWLLVLIFSERKKEEDVPIAINFLSGITSGVFLGTEVSTVMGKDGRKVVEIAPKDVDFDGKGKIENIKIIVDKNKTITCPKGTLSRKRNVNLYLPPKSSDLSHVFKDEFFGKVIMWATELRNLQNLEIDVLEEGRLRKDELLKKIGTGEISREFMKFTEELVKDALESAISIKDAKNKSTTTPLIPQKSTNE